MSLNCGIVGLPNVGKSTLFNVFTKKFTAQAENYPFCTIEPNIGTVVVEDNRLKNISEITNSQKIIYNLIEVVDIAGLIKGASTGEGLGNKFLGHIREVDAILHVVRCFEDEDVKHVHNSVNPISDIEVIDYELMIADSDSLEKMIQSTEKKIKSVASLKEDLEKMKSIQEGLQKGIPIRVSEYAKDPIFKNLLTSKPVLYVCNIGENDFNSNCRLAQLVIDKYGENSIVTLSAKLESEIALLDSEEERKMFLSEYNLTESRMNKLASAAYAILNLITFFTAGPKEARAWSIKNGSNARQAAGVIHSDFEKNFIRAEIMSYSDYVHYGGESQCKANGKLRVEGKEYIIQDGDIAHFRVGA